MVREVLLGMEDKDLGRLIHGDCVEVLRSMPEDSVDALCLDPPAGISFMSAKWDSNKGGRRQWVAWFTEVMEEALRVTKPGGHAFVWALPRTSHWTAWALEDAGWEIREVVHHIFGSGFPKSKNLGNGFGTALKPAAENWILCRAPLSEKSVTANFEKHGTGALNIDESRIHSGSDSELNDAREELDLPRGRWPANVILSHVSEVVEEIFHAPECNILSASSANCVAHCPVHLAGEDARIDDDGRVWIEIAPGCQRVGVKRVPLGGGGPAGGSHYVKAGYDHGIKSTRGLSRNSRANNPDGFEEVEAWECVDSCPVAELDRQSGTSKSSDKTRVNSGGVMKYGGENSRPSHDTFTKETSGFSDQGGASRFFKTFEGEPGFRYVAKASRSERNSFTKSLPRTKNKRKRYQQDRSGRWLARVINRHPTVKPLALMRYLVKLVCPPGGVVLDPFAGSGTTGVACVELGFDFVGIEADADYIKIAERRIVHAQKLYEEQQRIVEQLELV